MFLEKTPECSKTFEEGVLVFCAGFNFFNVSCKLLLIDFFNPVGALFSQNLRACSRQFTCNMILLNIACSDGAADTKALGQL